jgi:hypothetical protein
MATDGDKKLDGDTKATPASLPELLALKPAYVQGGFATPLN